jgi:quercetin dioxygenase-like cupin family protein/pyrroloquinoline quinone (PQQ) biosynthesis protein C
MIEPLERTMDIPLETDPLPAPPAPYNDTDGPAIFDAPSVLTDALRAEMNLHPLWSCRLLRACSSGHLRQSDWQYLFAQYSLYSSSFTRFVAAAIANCPSDYYRSRLTENLWEESGARRLEERHAQIFRDFLREGLNLDTRAISYDSATEQFVQHYLTHCLTGSPAYVSAFLSLGTESIVPRLYRTFYEGLLRAGVPEPKLRFFLIHMACDDEHAATLLELTMSYVGEPDWERQVRLGMQRALDLRLAFFDHLYQALLQRRLEGVIQGIQARRPSDAPLPTEQILFPRTTTGPVLYSNVVERLNVEFAVEKVPFAAEVLDPRLVHIPPGRCNERHKHAHESIFYVVTGKGRVRVGDQYLPVEPGDMVFVPRWVLHQTENQSSEEMIILAMTDYGLTSKAFIGDYDRTARLKRAEGTPAVTAIGSAPSPLD